MIPQAIKCWVGLHDWFHFAYYEHYRRRCIACGCIQQRTRYPGEHWYKLDHTGTYRLPH